MPPRNLATMLQMLRSAQSIVAYVHGVDEESFKDNEMLRSAVQYQIMIIGQAISRLSPEFLQAHPEIPWMPIKRMRNTLVHRYDDVNLDIVWDTATRDAPALITLIEPILKAGDLQPPSQSE